MGVIFMIDFLMLDARRKVCNTIRWGLFVGGIVETDNFCRCFVGFAHVKCRANLRLKYPADIYEDSHLKCFHAKFVRPPPNRTIFHRVLCGHCFPNLGF